jgi:hypothetical protein
MCRFESNMIKAPVASRVESEMHGTPGINNAGRLLAQTVSSFYSRDLETEFQEQRFMELDIPLQSMFLAQTVRLSNKRYPRASIRRN